MIQDGQYLLNQIKEIFDGESAYSKLSNADMDSEVTVKPKTYTGFKAPSEQKITIKESGNSVTFQYKRNVAKIKLNAKFCSYLSVIKLPLEYNSTLSITPFRHFGDNSFSFTCNFSSNGGFVANQ